METTSFVVGDEATLKVRLSEYQEELRSGSLDCRLLLQWAGDSKRCSRGVSLGEMHVSMNDDKSLLTSDACLKSSQFARKPV